MFLLGLQCILPVCRGAPSKNILPQIAQGILSLGCSSWVIELLCSCKGSHNHWKHEIRYITRFIIMMKIYKRGKNERPQNFLVVPGCFRFALDLIRADPSKGTNNYLINSEQNKKWNVPTFPSSSICVWSIHISCLGRSCDDFKMCSSNS